jgi:hypothetical protein
MTSIPALITHTENTIGPAHFIRPAGSFVEGQTRDPLNVVGGSEIAT